MKMKADTYPVLLHQVSSQLEQNRRGDVRSRIVPCDPPGIGAKKFQESSRRKQPVTTYIAGSVALEGAVVDLQNCTTVGKNSSALEVACPPPGITAKI